jgi:aryl-alcohol dehydrogenase-like predicted oxidoreductase
MLEAAGVRGWAPFVTMQNHYNLIYREEEREMMPFCVERKIGVIPWSPLARGALARLPGAATTRSATDAYARNLYGAGLNAADQAVVAAVQKVAVARGVPPAHVALAWVSSKPGVVAPIIGASKLNHVDDALKSLSIKLSPEETASLEAPYQPHPIAGHS